MEAQLAFTIARLFKESLDLFIPYRTDELIELLSLRLCSSDSSDIVVLSEQHSQRKANIANASDSDFHARDILIILKYRLCLFCIIRYNREDVNPERLAERKQLIHGWSVVIGFESGQ